ncbi:HdeD family acid-resistance protein [uncultured Maricaulis sp.]|uniref:HdeD family acid-resistance protein n=1 Tax=uncultured Maricaulis sp. TaxID=174710 RepID=UPI0030DD8D19|tara:strand:+ start:31397 stop:31966 length:570 start_codon:yes stop_codon:yes gene_type:complete
MTNDLDEVRVFDLNRQWGWFVGLGAVFLLFGLIAFGNLFAATMVSVLFVGILVGAAGIAFLVHAFQVRGWQNVTFWALSGGLYTIAGLLAFINPTLASTVITLVMAVSFMAAGAFRIWFGLQLRPGRGWQLIALSGAVTALIGLIIAFSWPASGLWLLGLILAVDLTVQGAAMVLFGLGLRPVLPVGGD